MTLRHFRIFLAVCERLSMTEAARQLHISQPSVTQAIHEMEDHYGILLFERLGHHIYLTAAGENLKQYAYQILSLCQQAEDVGVPVAGGAEVHGQHDALSEDVGVGPGLEQHSDDLAVLVGHDGAHERRQALVVQNVHGRARVEQ